MLEFRQVLIREMGGRMSGPLSVLVYVAAVIVLLAAYKIVKRWRDRGKRHFGDADAYEGNLVTPSAGEHPPTAGGLSGGGHASHAGRRFGETGNTVHIPPGVIGGERRR
jgi:hypothetical protein